MNIALLGYGKMGKAIEEIALKNGHNIVIRIHDQNLEEFTKENLQKADVAIEFTSPLSAVTNILFCSRCAGSLRHNRLVRKNGNGPTKMQGKKRHIFICK